MPNILSEFASTPTGRAFFDNFSKLAHAMADIAVELKKMNQRQECALPPEELPDGIVDQIGRVEGDDTG